MTTSANPFVFTPGNSWLHRWTRAEARHWTLRVATKGIFFLVLEGATIALRFWLPIGPWATFLAYLIIFSVTFLAEWHYGNLPKAGRLVQMACTIFILGIFIGASVLWEMTRLMHRAQLLPSLPGSLGETMLLMLVMLGLIVALLGIGAVFLVTTSLGRLARKSVWLAVVLSQLPRFDQEFAIASQALMSFEPAEAAVRRRAWQFSKRWTLGLALLLATDLYDIMTVRGLQVYLAVQERRTVERE